MSRTRRLAVILTAWAIPIAWVTGALLADPVDGDTPLQEGDTILTRYPFLDAVSLGRVRTCVPDPDAGQASRKLPTGRMCITPSVR